MPEMIADVALKYPPVSVGDRFEAREPKAKLLSVNGKAHYVAEPVAVLTVEGQIDEETLHAVKNAWAEVAQTDTGPAIKQKRRYRRRDMRADD